MERLRAIYEELGAPSASQLRYAALQDGLQVSMKQVQTFVNQLQENQSFRGKPQSEGLTASRGPDQEWQIDLIDLKQFGNSNKDTLIAMDPFSGKIAMEGLASKRSEVVAEGFKKILQRWPKRTAVSHDNGNEWKNAFATMLRTEGIVYKIKRFINSLERLDRGIQGMKQKLGLKTTRI